MFWSFGIDQLPFVILSYLFAGKLNKYELPTTCYLTTEAWTPDTGLVTATMKLKRVNIHEHYKQQIKDMFSD